MILEAASVHPYGSFWLDVLDKGIKAAAVIVGGAWALFNVRKSRTFQRKLEVSVGGEIFEKNDAYYVMVRPALKNLGQTLCSIQQKGTGLEVIALATSGRKHVSACPVFDEDASIEPGEQVEDPKVIPIPDPAQFVALLVKLRIVSAGEEWNAKCVVREKDMVTSVPTAGDEYA